MTLAGELDHLGAEIDAHAPGWFERGEQVAQSTAHFEHAQTRRDKKGEIIAQVSLIITLRFARTERGALFINARRSIIGLCS